MEAILVTNQAEVYKAVEYFQSKGYSLGDWLTNINYEYRQLCCKDGVPTIYICIFNNVIDVSYGPYAREKCNIITLPKHEFKAGQLVRIIDNSNCYGFTMIPSVFSEYSIWAILCVGGQFPSTSANRPNNLLLLNTKNEHHYIFSHTDDVELAKPPIKINGCTVVINTDKSLTVGATKLSAATVQELINRINNNV